MLKQLWLCARTILFAAVLAACAATSAARAEQPAKEKAAGSGSKAAPEKRKSPYRPDRYAGRAKKYFANFWGIDSLNVRLAESGLMVRFSYRVIEPGKAAALNDKRNEAKLIDPQAGVSLVVPAMEKIGQLRQTATPEEGMSYWMAFSNKGRPVKKGHRVDVVIGSFRAQGLVVD